MIGREIDGIAQRCPTCGQATAFVLRERDLDERGNTRLSVWTETVPHNRADCTRMLALAKEEWPSLW